MREPGDRPGAGGADVDGGDVDHPQFVRDDRRGGWGDLVGGERGDEHHVDLAGVDAGVLHGEPRGGAGKLADALSGGGVAALEDACASLDPLGADAEPAGDLLVGDLALR